MTGLETTKALRSVIVAVVWLLGLESVLFGIDSAFSGRTVDTTSHLALQALIAGGMALAFVLASRRLSASALLAGVVVALAHLAWLAISANYVMWSGNEMSIILIFATVPAATLISTAVFSFVVRRIAARPARSA
jgi:hypothetical protein